MRLPLSRINTSSFRPAAPTRLPSLFHSTYSTMPRSAETQGYKV